MANIKSAKKRILVTAIRTERNKAYRSRIKTCIKNVELAVKDGDKAAAEAAFATAQSQIHKAAGKGLYHGNNAARKISRLSRLVASI